MNTQDKFKRASCIGCGNHTFTVEFDRHHNLMTLFCTKCDHHIEFSAYPEDPVDLGLVETILYPVE